MSDVKTFTIGDLGYSLVEVPAAADHDGVARLRGRDGWGYVVRPEKFVARKGAGWASFARARWGGLKKLFPDGPIMTATQVRNFDRLLAGNRPVSSASGTPPSTASAPTMARTSRRR